MKKPNESGLVKSCLQLLAMCGVFAWRNNAGAIPLKGGGYRKFNGMRGASDILGILPDPPSRRGLFLAVECKMRGQYPTKSQKDFLAEVDRRGGVAVLAYSIDDLASVLREHGLMV